MSSDWILDINATKEFITEKNKITFAGSNKQSINVYNALYLPICTNKLKNKYYWQFNCESGKNIFVGVTTKDLFKSGYAIQGAFYGRNLSDGSCLLVGDFGESIEKNCEIGFFLEKNENELKIYIIRNGVPLGLAYHFTNDIPEILYPTVQFYDQATIEIIEKNDFIPDNFLIKKQTGSGIVGEWELIKFIDKNKTESYPNYKLYIKQDKNVLNLILRVVNSVNINFNINQDNGKENDYTFKNMYSTLMAGPRQEMENENYISNVLKDLINFNLSENKQELTIKCKENFEIVFRRFNPQFQPYTTNLFIKKL